MYKKFNLLSHFNMKTDKNFNPKNNFSINIGIEILNNFEMHNIRGGETTEKLRTKEMDVYDTRED
jgi:hypothetical protein